MPDAKDLVRIFIADDHPIFRDALKTLLACESQCRVMGEASDGEETLRLLPKYEPDILLLDLHMPGISGMDVLQSLEENQSKVKTIVMCGIANPKEISKIFNLGSQGLILKESPSEILIKSIKTVMKGKYWIGKHAVSNPADKIKNYKESNRNQAQNNYGLTPREMEVIRSVVAGRINKEIAKELSISEQTVKHHITNVFNKLGVYNRLELTLFVFHHGIIESGKIL